MIISRSLRFFPVNATRQISLVKPKITFRPRAYLYNQIMSASTAPHPVSSTAEAPAPAVGSEQTAAGASAPAAAAGKPAKEAKAGKPKKDKAASGPSGPLELSPAPEYFDERIKIFDEYKKKYDAEIAGMPYTPTLPGMADE